MSENIDADILTECYASRVTRAFRGDKAIVTIVVLLRLDNRYGCLETTDGKELSATMLFLRNE